MITTGYLQILDDNPDATMREFALRCARNIGYLGYMRDVPMDTPLPEVVEPDDAYYREELAKAEKRLGSLTAMSPDERTEAAEKDHAYTVGVCAKANAEHAARRARLGAMRSKVADWVVRQELDSLKSFMVEQLEIGLIGCSEAPPLPAPQTPDEWYFAQLRSAERDVTYFKQKIHDARVVAMRATDWLNLLRISLEAP